MDVTPKKDYDYLARKYIGEDYQSLTAQEQTQQALNAVGFTRELISAAHDGAARMPDDEAKTCAHQLLQSIDNLETALREYNAIKTK